MSVEHRLKNTLGLSQKAIHKVNHGGPERLEVLIWLLLRMEEIFDNLPGASCGTFVYRETTLLNELQKEELDVKLILELAVEVNKWVTRVKQCLSENPKLNALYNELHKVN